MPHEKVTQAITHKHECLRAPIAVGPIHRLDRTYPSKKSHTHKQTRIPSRQIAHLSQEDATDPKSRHKGKFESEAYLAEIGMPYTSIRPTYIYGPLNYNPLEQYFFERLDQDRTVIVPGERARIVHRNGLTVARGWDVEDRSLRACGGGWLQVVVGQSLIALQDFLIGWVGGYHGHEFLLFVEPVLVVGAFMVARSCSSSR